jgi:hypothetical protein
MITLEATLTLCFSFFYYSFLQSVTRIWRMSEVVSGNTKQTPWPLSASEPYQPGDRRLLAKLVLTFADRGCRVICATDPHGRILGFLDRSRYYVFQVTPQLYSRGWVDPVPDPLLFRKSGSAGNRTRDIWICTQELWPVDHRGGPIDLKKICNARFPLYVECEIRIWSWRTFSLA